WQPRWSQKPLGESPCGFESRPRHERSELVAPPHSRAYTPFPLTFPHMMTRNIERRLLSLSGEISAVRDETGILQEQLAFQGEVVDDARVRALVAETPIADREFRIASEDHQR